MISTPRQGAISSAVLTVLLVACAASSIPSATETPFVRPSLPAHLVASPLVLHPWNEAGDGALLTGRLVLEDGCLYVVSDDSNERWVPSFPYPGTDWDGTSVVAGDQVISNGELAMFGGGETDLTEANVDAFDWVKPPGPACLTTGKAWWVYNGTTSP